MARKIFVSYKHSDDSVLPLNGETTARAYVEELINLFEGDEIYKGEGNEDLSEFKDETIETHLKDKIYDSSITLVLMSPNMRNDYEKESDQWIPWEVAYSLKEITRGGRTSHSNAVLAVVLPDRNGLYSYFLEEGTCPHCNAVNLRTDKIFQILRDNMFNVKNPTYSNCPNHWPNPVYLGESSYILSVKWTDFINDKDHFLSRAEKIRDNIDEYDIVKEVKDG